MSNRSVIDRFNSFSGIDNYPRTKIIVYTTGGIVVGAIFLPIYAICKTVGIFSIYQFKVFSCIGAVFGGTGGAMIGADMVQL
jgi:hypothetical protein